MNNKKITILGTCIFILLIIWAYFSLYNSPVEGPEQSRGIVDNINEKLVEVNSDVDTSDWVTYKNEEYGFSFRYPERWGFIEELPNLNQIRIMEMDSKKFSAIISVKKCVENCFNINTKSGIATLTNDSFNGCEIRLWHLFYINNQEVIISTIRTSLDDVDTINIPEDKCLKLLNRIDKKRIESSPAGGQHVELLELEIPGSGRKAYNTFKVIMESFSEL